MFGAVFIAELGDKTQLATMLFSANSQTSRWTVFFAASGALVLTSALGVALGAVLNQMISEKTLNLFAGLLFIGIGAWTLWRS